MLARPSRANYLVEGGGGRALITATDSLGEALAGRTGTYIVR